MSESSARSVLREIARQGGSYAPSWQMDGAEAERLAQLTDEAARTMNGDTEKVAVTVRQLSQLLAAWVQGHPAATQGEV